MSADLTALVAELRRGADECSREGVAGWGNTMTDAAEAIASLLRAVPPLPVVARVASNLRLEWVGDSLYMAGNELVLKADAAAALSSLQARLDALRQCYDHLEGEHAQEVCNVAKMEARLDAVERDAARYRWLRSPFTSSAEVREMTRIVSELFDEDMDAAIDAATQEAKG
jgi:hypothetical protein